MVTGRKLLLADDSVTIQKVVDLTFGDEGMQVTTVGNGEQAILKLEEIQPDIVLADIFMPGRTGYEVCEHIKRDERFRHIPVLLLVGSFEPFDEAEARRVGADDYLTKPFQSIRQLVSKVTSLLSGGGGEDEATTRDLNLPKEAAERQADRAGSDIHTADTAPLPQGGEAAQLMERARRAGHESLDDGMIEARRAPDATAASSPRDTTSAVDTRPTAPLSPSDMAEAGIRMGAQQQPASTDMHETIRDFKMEEMSEESTSDEPQINAPANYMTRAQAADDALLDLGDIEPPPAVMEADDFILDLQDDARPALPARQSAPSETAAAPHASAFAAPSAMETDAPSHGADSSPATEGSFSSSEFDQKAFQLVGEPYETSRGTIEEPISTGASMAEETDVRAGMEEGASLPAMDEEASLYAAPEGAAREVAEPQVVSHGMTGEAYAESEETSEAPEAGAAWGGAETESAGGATSETQQAHAGAITPDQLSPEAIDAIARRAVELLSTKVVEEVAWEVVPQLAELLIKRRLEEEKSEAK